MKATKWIAMLLVLVCLAGCAPAAQQAEETVKETWQMNDELLEMIKTGAGCSDSRAKAILEVLREINLAEPVAVCPAEGNSIVVETDDGKKYEVGLDKKFYVFSVMDLESGENLYAVFE